MKNGAVIKMLEFQYPDADRIDVEFKCVIKNRWIFEVTVYFDDVDSYFVEMIEIIKTTVREESTF